MPGDGQRPRRRSTWGLFLVMILRDWHGRCIKGSRSPNKGKRRDWKKRFWAKVDKRGEDECWLWKGKKRDGYGRLYCGGKYIGAHRLAFFLSTGQWPDPELDMCHNCPGGDNPSCVNPKHLWQGTTKENIQDASAKGRMSHPKPGSAGENHYKSWLTWGEVDEIRKEVAEGIMQKDVAAEHGIGKTSVWSMVHFKTWKPANRPLPAASTIPVDQAPRF